jgi:hypothetical protein
MAIGAYSIEVIGAYFIDGYWCLFYSWLLMDIILMVIDTYYISAYYWLLY